MVAGLWLVHRIRPCSLAHDKGIRIGGWVKGMERVRTVHKRRKKKKRRHRVHGIRSYGYGFFLLPLLACCLNSGHVWRY